MDREADRQTDRQTDNSIVASTGLCTASYTLTPCKNEVSAKEANQDLVRKIGYGYRNELSVIFLIYRRMTKAVAIY